jgi:DNA-binding response OmpR family regulator
VNKHWVRLESPEGQVELRLSGSSWQLLIRASASDQFKLSATGDLMGTTTPIPSPGEDISVDTLRLDAATRLVTLAGKPIALTPTEFSILATLMSQPRRVFSKQELNVPTSANTHVLRLRKKLGDPFIVNRIGHGWSLLPT